MNTQKIKVKLLEKGNIIVDGDRLLMVRSVSPGMVRGEAIIYFKDVKNDKSDWTSMNKESLITIKE
jgi:hypothetical protein